MNRNKSFSWTKYILKNILRFILTRSSQQAFWTYRMLAHLGDHTDLEYNVTCSWRYVVYFRYLELVEWYEKLSFLWPKILLNIITRHKNILQWYKYYAIVLETYVPYLIFAGNRQTSLLRLSISQWVNDRPRKYRDERVWVYCKYLVYIMTMTDCWAYENL